jgi:hypothetical protein
MTYQGSRPVLHYGDSRHKAGPTPQGLVAQPLMDWLQGGGGANTSGEGGELPRRLFIASSTPTGERGSMRGEPLSEA